ncbi:MAG: cupin domain-containing protein [Rhodobacteraceae bacterium]|nr:cupin domain-containing protein [Paracoccaceae bacterium]
MVVVRRAEVRTDSATPEIRERFGQYDALLYSDTGGLTQFGAFVETIQPGTRTSDRHWHSDEDEFLYMLQGSVTVIENDGEHVIGPGDAACWPAGVPNGHVVFNHTDAPASYVLVGTRSQNDRAYYSEIDKVLVRENGQRRLIRRDGSPYEGPETGSET